MLPETECTLTKRGLAAVITQHSHNKVAYLYEHRENKTVALG